MPESPIPGIPEGLQHFDALIEALAADDPALVRFILGYHSTLAVCARCRVYIPFPETWTLAEGLQVAPNHHVIHPSGALLTQRGALYYRDCAPAVTLCRICGCSDEAGCREGCWWIEPDLCSACHRQEQGKEKETVTL